MLEGFVPWPKERAKQYRENGCWEGITLGEMLSQRAEQFPNRIVISAYEEHVTYRQLDDKTDELASGFQQLGIEKEDRVVVQLPNWIEFIETCFALYKIGALPVFALPSHRYVEISYFCKFTEAKAYICPKFYNSFDYETLAKRVKSETASLQHIILVGDDAEDYVSFSALYAKKPLQTTDVKSSDVAFLQLSGGSTGLSKLIPRTHDEYIYTLKRSVEICHVTEKTRFLVVLPIAHNYPMSSPGFLGIIYGGGRIILSDGSSPDEAFPLIEKEQVTMCALVPPIAIHWLSVARNRQEDLSSLEVLLVGGSKLSAEVAKKIAPTFGCQLQQVFGMAEGLVNYTRLDDPDDLVVQTQGRPLSPYDEVKVVDENDQEVPRNVVGHLLTRGPYTIQGYYKAPEHNAKAFTKDGFYRTGDLVSINDLGYLTVEGRNKDQINRGGEKIAAEEVENHLLAHPSVLDVAIVAMPDEYLGEKSCAFVILKDEKIKKRELKAFLRERGLASYKIPDRIEWIDAFPKTHLGKVSKKDLRKYIQEKLNDQKSKVSVKG